MRFLRTAAAVGVVAGSLVSGGRARAQSPADLATGRQLFAEALNDEEQGRFAEALGKYRRVQHIRDTANIRYRMGSSLEHLGKIAQAMGEYTAAVRLGSNGDAEVVQGAQSRLDVLGPRVAHVTFRFTSPAPPDARITVDGELVTSPAFADVTLDPGTHVVAATATSRTPVRTQIDLTEGAHTDVPIALEPDAAPPPSRTSYKTAGIVTGAAGGALLIGGVIVLVLRSHEIATLKDSCPNGDCPASREDELASAHDRATLEGPAGIVLLATGAAALGTGIAFFALSGDTKSAARLVPAPISNGAALSFSRTF
jgi:hypothetical protein